MKYAIDSGLTKSESKLKTAAVGFAAAMVAVIFSVGLASAQAPQLKTTGGITAVAGAVEFELNATAFGEHPKKGVFGQVAYSNSLGSSFKGVVDKCYEQDGNESVFVGEVTEATGFAAGQDFRVAVQDNGNGGSGDPDRVRVQVAADLSCGDESNFPGVRTEGNLKVH